MSVCGAWLDSVPTDEKYSLEPNQFQIASFLRLTCKQGGGPVWQNDCMVSGYSDLLKELDSPHQTEPTGKYLKTGETSQLSTSTILILI